jgi:hypothetical protein
MSGASKWPISELKIALIRAPNGMPLPNATAFILAADIIGLGVEIDPVFLAGDVARGIVVHRDAAGQRILFLGGAARGSRWGTEERHPQLGVQTRRLLPGRDRIEIASLSSQMTA